MDPKSDWTILWDLNLSSLLKFGQWPSAFFSSVSVLVLINQPEEFHA